jgi:hypothetical protein
MPGKNKFLGNNKKDKWELINNNKDNSKSEGELNNKTEESYKPSNSKWKFNDKEKFNRKKLNNTKE